MEIQQAITRSTQAAGHGQTYADLLVRLQRSIYGDPMAMQADWLVLEEILNGTARTTRG